MIARVRGRHRASTPWTWRHDDHVRRPAGLQRGAGHPDAAAGARRRARAARRWPYRAVLIDDGSTDATIAEAEAAVARHGRAPAADGAPPRREPRPRAARCGPASTGASRTATDDDVMVTLDADNTHPPALIPALVEQVEAGADIAIASRYEPGAVVTGVPGPAPRAVRGRPRRPAPRLPDPRRARTTPAASAPSGSRRCGWRARSTATS